MDSIELAALPESTPLVAALVTMRARNESGLICVGEKHNLTLVTPRDVVLAIHEDLNVLGQIRTGRHVTADLVPFESATIGRSQGWIVTAPEGGVLKGRGERVIGIGADVSNLRRHFDQGNDFTVAKLDIGRAIIVTASEKYAQMLRMSVPNYVCSCSSEFHDFDLQPPTCQLHGCPVYRTI